MKILVLYQITTIAIKKKLYIKIGQYPMSLGDNTNNDEIITVSINS